MLWDDPERIRRCHLRDLYIDILKRGAKITEIEEFSHGNRTCYRVVVARPGAYPILTPEWTWKYTKYERQYILQPRITVWDRDHAYVTEEDYKR